MTWKVDAEALLKAAAELDNESVQVTTPALTDFFVNLETVLFDAIKESGAEKGSLRKAADRVALTGMAGLLERVAKLSDADLKSWLSRGQFDSDATFDHGENVSEGQRMHRPDNPDAGWGASPPSSSSPATGRAKAVRKSLDRLANATPAEVERAKSGTSQLDPDTLEDLKKEGVFDQFEGQLGAEVYKEFYHGNVNRETELRKSLVANAATLVTRVRKLRDAERSKQVILEGNKDDDWEARARQGRG